MNISKTMRIKEAAAVWDNPRVAFLEKWAEMFDLPLAEIRQSHLIQYETARALESPKSVITVEMRALTLLLEEAGLPVPPVPDIEEGASCKRLRIDPTLPL